MRDRREGVDETLAIVAEEVIRAAEAAGHLPKGGPYGTITLPDPALGACCIGSAVMGPQYCTCWEQVFDVDQAEVRPGEAVARKSMCGDCAYRPGSPERGGDERYNGDQEFLDDIVLRGDAFWCHQGMRKVVRLRHPSGAEVVIETDHYEPPKDGAVPYKADGSPGDICGGWAARRSHTLTRRAAS